MDSKNVNSLKENIHGFDMVHSPSLKNVHGAYAYVVLEMETKTKI
jgi:hypothetical protein